MIAVTKKAREALRKLATNDIAASAMKIVLMGYG
jgi:hypothetical protein